MRSTTSKKHSGRQQARDVGKRRPASKRTRQNDVQPSDAARESEKKKLAVGALLNFYRTLRELSRQELAKTAAVSVSLLSMVENGARLPSQEVLEKVSNALRLTTYQRLQLHALAGFSAQLPEAPGWEIRADDLIAGVPLFLRNMQLEFDFQRKLDIEESWVVTSRPMALEEPVLSMLKEKLLSTSAKYIYFVDCRYGNRDFATLWTRLDLDSDSRWLRKPIEERSKQLAFVLSPPTLCASIHTIALFNPRSSTKPRFGRSAYFGGGTPIGVYPLDRVLYEQLVSTLKEVLVDCERNPGHSFPRDSTLWGTFKLVDFPDVTKPLRPTIPANREEQSA